MAMPRSSPRASPRRSCHLIMGRTIRFIPKLYITISVDTPSTTIRLDIATPRPWLLTPPSVSRAVNSHPLPGCSAVVLSEYVPEQPSALDGEQQQVQPDQRARNAPDAVSLSAGVKAGADGSCEECAPAFRFVLFRLSRHELLKIMYLEALRRKATASAVSSPLSRGPRGGGGLRGLRRGAAPGRRRA